MKTFPRFFLALVLMTLGGCVQLLPPPPAPPQIIKLNPEILVDESIPSVKWQLVVAEPLAPQPLDSTKIVVQKTSPKLTQYFDHIQGKEWTERLPPMVQSLIIEGFEQSGKILGVGRPTQGLTPTYILLITIYDFQVDYGDASSVPMVHLRMTAKLMSPQTRKVIASNTFEQKLTSKNDSFSAIIDGFDEALSHSISDIVHWTLAR